MYWYAIFATAYWETVGIDEGRPEMSEQCEPFFILSRYTQQVKAGVQDRQFAISRSSTITHVIRKVLPGTSSLFLHKLKDFLGRSHILGPLPRRPQFTLLSVDETQLFLEPTLACG